ncbi:MAG: sodium/proline symporter [Firmicutes bacterium]|nr:sodium/proline symporter [Bacillota bacterium]
MREAKKDAKSFLVAERKVPWFIAAVSDRASSMSGWWTLGYVGQASTTGMATCWSGWGCVLTPIINWTLFAKRLRALGEKYNALTFSELLVARTNAKTPALRVVAAISIIIFTTAYMSSQLVAEGKVLAEILNVTIAPAVAISGALILLYTFTGGYMGVAKANTVQGILMMVTLIFVPFYSLIRGGGWEHIMGHAKALNPMIFDWTGGGSLTQQIITIAGMFAICLPAWGQPHIMTRMLSIASADRSYIRRSVTVAGAMDVIATYCAFMMGVVALGYFGVLPDPENAIYYLVNEFMGPVIGGIMICGVIAAIMSTAAAMMLIVSGELVNSIYFQWLKKGTGVSQEQLVKYNKLMLIPVMAVAVWMGSSGGSAWDLVIYAYNGMGASFTPVIFACVLWKGLTKEGAIASIAAGTISVIVWDKLQLTAAMLPDYTVPSSFNVLPCIVIATICMIIVSKLTKAPENAAEDMRLMKAARIG